nr:transposase [Ktedonobacteraceae bacterium]
GFHLTHDNRVTLSKIGSIKMVYHREVKESIKTCTIHKSSTGKWSVCFSVECEPERLPETPEQVGIDVGLTTFATLSDGQEIANPRFFRKNVSSLGRSVSISPPSELAASVCFDDQAETPNHPSVRKSTAAVIFPKNDRIGVKNWQSTFKRAKTISKAAGGVSLPSLCGKAKPKIPLPMVSEPPERLKWPAMRACQRSRLQPTKPKPLT